MFGRSATTITDNRRGKTRAGKRQGWGTTLKSRTGTTIVSESTQYPQIHMDDYVDEARAPKA
eukprot:11095590-Lingulodinium_polyedra.AAC.1